MACTLQTLGTFRLSIDGKDVTSPATQKARSLLAYLIWNRGLELARDRIVEVFWPDCEPERGRSSLNTALWSIRRSLREGDAQAETMLNASKTRLLWQGDVTLDIAEFERRASDPQWTIRQSAISLYRGDFLDGDYGDWAITTRERANAIFEALLLEAVETDRDVASARLLIDRGTLDEAPYDLVVAHEIATGRRAAAVAAANRYRAALAEINAQPSLTFEARLIDVQSASGDEPRLPFCGRMQAFSAMESILRRCADGKTATVLISAEAGSGKSATLQQAMEVARRLKLHALHVECVNEDTRPFGPWGELFKAEDATSLAIALRNAPNAGACYFIDDAHHLRGDALHAFVQLVRRENTKAAFVIATRPEGLRALLMQLGEIARIDLAPLTCDEILDGVLRIAPDDAKAIAQFVHARSGGNPFFANRIFESLVRESHLQRDDTGVLRLTQSLADAATPRDLREYIEARIFSAGENAATVACALALDPHASGDDLVEVCGIGEERTFDAIDSLLALSLIGPEEHDAEFRFTHDIIRETAARCLNSARRTRLHASFAQRLESAARRESLMRRAHHLRDSGDVLPAAQAYARAASAMLTANAWRDAMLCIDAGIALAGELRDSHEMHRAFAALHEVGARAQEEGGDAKAALDHATQRVIHARKANDPAELSRALARRSWSIMETGDATAAASGLDEALAIARETGEAELITYALIHRSLYFQFIGDQRAVDTVAEMVAIADGANDADDRVAMRDRYIAVACVWGQLDDAERIAEETDSFRHQAAPQIQGLFQVRCASLWYLRGDLDRSDDELARVSAMLHSKHPPAAIRYGMILPFIHLAFAAQAATNARARGDWHEAVTHAETMLQNPMANGHSRRGFARLHLVEALLGRREAGDLERAQAEVALLPDAAPAPNLLGMSLTKASAVARIAASLGAADADEKIDEAAALLKKLALQTPLDTNRSLATLAEVTVAARGQRAG